MTRVTTTFLIRLGYSHYRGSSRSPISALLDTLDTAGAASDGCSTSFSPAGAWACSGQRRSAHRYNFIQPVDTNHIDALLKSATLLEHAAIPVLQYGAWFDPEQVTRTLQRIPRMLRHQRRKTPRAASDVASVTSWRLLDALGSRFAQVAPDCTDEQFARALWAYGVSRRPHAEVVGAACEQLPRRLGSMAMPQLATAAWSLAAATSLAPKPVQQPVREALMAIARHIVATRPASLTAATGAVPALPPHGPPAPSAPGKAASGPRPAANTRPATAAPAPAAASSSPAAAAAGSGAAGAITPAADVVAAAVAADRAALEADRPWMDHRSALQLAWAFAALDVRDTQALDVIADAAASRMSSQLQAHDWTTGPLSPRTTYIYWTIRGWQSWPRPRPPRARTGGRPSRYLRDERPRLVLRDFTLSSLAPLLTAFRRLGHRHEGLLQASAAHVVASAGPSLRVAPADLTRVVGSLESLRFRNAPALTALLTSSRLSGLPAPVLARLAVLASEWGVPSRRRGLYGRIAAQLVARAWIDGGAAAASPARDLVPQGSTASAEPADEAADAPPRLEPRAKQSWEQRLPSLSWRTDDASLEWEEDQWGAVARRPEDECGAAELARVLLALAKVGYTDPNPDAPQAAALFARVWPHRASLPGDALADLALAAGYFDKQLDSTGPEYGLPPALDITREAAHIVLYGAEAAGGGGGAVVGLGRRLLGYGGGRAAEPRAATSAAQAAEIRRDVRLSSGGALRLALALTRRTDVVSEEELRAALSLLDSGVANRRQLGEVIRRMRHRGKDGLLPQQLLAAVGDTAVAVSQ